MANMTVTTEANHIGEVWLMDVIRAQEFELVIAPKVNRSWKYMGHGDVYHIPRIGNLTANDKSAGSAWTPEALTDTEQTITINVHNVAGFQLEDIAGLLSNTDLKAEYQKKIGYTLGRKVDTNLASLPQNFSQIVGTLGKELTWDNYLRGWQYLADAGVDGTRDDVCIFLSPAAVVGAMKLDVLTNRDYRSDSGRGSERMQVGTILDGMPVIRSNLIRSPAAGQAECWMADRRAIALMMAQEPEMVSEYIAKELSWVVGGHQIYGYAEVDRYSEAEANVTATDEWAVLMRTVG